MDSEIVVELLRVLEPISRKFLSPDDYGYPDEVEPGDVDDSTLEEVFISRATIRGARELIRKLSTAAEPAGAGNRFIQHTDRGKTHEQ